jgi:hypothetical protein
MEAVSKVKLVTMNEVEMYYKVLEMAFVLPNSGWSGQADKKLFIRWPLLF